MGNSHVYEHKCPVITSSFPKTSEPSLYREVWVLQFSSHFLGQNWRTFIEERSSFGLPQKFVTRIWVCPLIIPRVCLRGKALVWGHCCRFQKEKFTKLHYHAIGVDIWGTTPRIALRQFNDQGLVPLEDDGSHKQTMQARVYTLTSREVDKSALKTQMVGVTIRMKPKI